MLFLLKVLILCSFDSISERRPIMLFNCFPFLQCFTYVHTNRSSFVSPRQQASSFQLCDFVTSHYITMLHICIIDTLWLV